MRRCSAAQQDLVAQPLRGSSLTPRRTRVHPAVSCRPVGVDQTANRPLAVVLSVGYLWYTVRFARITRSPLSLESRAYARDLLKASVVYLPLLMAAMMLDAKGRLLF